VTQTGASSAQHTPGPWQWNPDDHEISDGGSLDAQRRRVALAIGYDAEYEANARLIAAAPDLLAAAKDWVRWTNGEIGESTDLDLATHVLRMQMAISKAEGREA
jgi:hypothetical protein